MASLQQIEANRRNAQRSTGPRSVEGKAASRFNALKTGIDAQSLVVRGEDAAALDALTAEYYAHLQPVGPQEAVWVDTLIRDDWFLRRFAKTDAQIFEYELQTSYKLIEACPLGQAFDRASSTLSRLQRRIDATERSYQRASKELAALQEKRLTQPEPPSNQPVAEAAPPSAGPSIGFVPQPLPTPIQFPVPPTPAPPAPLEIVKTPVLGPRK